MTKNESHNESNEQQKASVQDFNAVPWVAGAVLILGLAVLAGIYRNRTITVQSVHFEGNYFVEQDELEKQVDIPTGVKPDSLDYLSIINQIEKIPYVKYADVNVEPSGDLLIHITERRPFAILVKGSTKMYIDEDGIKLSIIPGKAVDVPILYGFKTDPAGDTLKTSAFEAARTFLQEIRRKPVSDATISEVAWTRSEGIVALTNENGVKLVFGKEDFKTRLRNWEVFYAEVIRKKGIKKMKSIDLRFRGQIVTQES